jgi:hypothetical protein
MLDTIASESRLRLKLSAHRRHSALVFVERGTAVYDVSVNNKLLSPSLALIFPLLYLGRLSILAAAI